MSSGRQAMAFATAASFCATTGDATTGALDANREGSWRRNQLRLEAGVSVPSFASEI